MTINDKVIYLSLEQSRRAVLLCILAQRFMPATKRFGAVIWGQSGIGKNGITDGLCDTLSTLSKAPWQFHDEDLSSCSPEDIKGLPRLTDAGACFAPFINLDKDSKGIFRVDEIDRPAYYQSLIALVKFGIDRTTSHHLPLNWFFLGLGNGSSDQHTHELSEHVKGRMCHLYVSTNAGGALDDVNAYYEKQGMPAALIKFNNMNPIATRDEFEEIAVDNNRTREYAGCILAAFETFKNHANAPKFDDILPACLAGVIGKASAMELLKVYEMENLPSLSQVCNDPKGATMVSDLSTRHKHLSHLVSEVGADCAKASKLITYLLRTESEQVRFMLDKMIALCPDIAKNPEYVKWLARFG